MKLNQPISSLLLVLLLCQHHTYSQTSRNFQIFKDVLFYGGYSKLDTIPNVQDIHRQGAERLETYLVAKRLSDSVLNQMEDNLTLNIQVRSTCDNYDRIGCVKLTFVPKSDAGTYPKAITASTKRIEIARFITPFMDSKKQPNLVPYKYEINNVALILKDSTIRSRFEIWLEFEIFGRYTVEGCTPGRSVFYGSLYLTTISSAPTQESAPIFVPITTQEKLFNYKGKKIQGTDTIGKTIKTIAFYTKDTIYNPNIYLIISNHGAVKNGEEYYTRNHFVYMDNQLLTKFKPNVGSCEPFRIYNTQPNNVYTSSRKSDFLWSKYSNWCPGAGLPIRIIPTATIYPGKHTVTIEVPDAVFYNHEGNFPFSIYLQGNAQNVKEKEPIVASNKPKDANLFCDAKKNSVYIETTEAIQNIQLYDTKNQLRWEGAAKTIDISNFESGMYRVKICFTKNECVTKSFEFIKTINNTTK